MRLLGMGNESHVMKGDRSVIRALFAVVLAVSAVSALPTAAFAQDGGGSGQNDNIALAENTEDDSSVFDFSFSIERVVADVVDNDNAAIAVASCNRCQTVAIAVQVVLIFSDPSVVTTDNLAFALNIECSLCETLASAYQYVLTTGGPVHFTNEGNKAIHDLKRQMKNLGEGDLSIFDIQAALDSLVSQLFAIVGSELVAAGASKSGSAPDEDAVDDATPESTESPATESTPEPTATPTPTPTESTTPSPSPSPSPYPSPSPSPSPSPTA
jgi:putative peptide zinc metalloprotease protein